MQCILYLTFYILQRNVFYLTSHFALFCPRVLAGGCWMLREGEKTIKTTKYFDFTSGWASVCTSPKWKSTKTGNRSSQTFLVVLKHPVNLSETISQCPGTQVSSIWSVWIFSTGAKTHLCSRQKCLTRINILILPLTEIKKSPQTQHRNKLSKLSNQPFFSPRQIFDVEHLFELHQFD